MSPEQIERHINSICWGGRFAFVKNRKGRSLTIIIKPLSLKDKNFVDFIYEQALEEAKDSGVSTRFEIRDDLKRKQLWSEVDEQKITESKKKLAIIEKDINGMVNGSRAHRITKALLDVLKKDVWDMCSYRNSLFGPSAEEYAEGTKSAAIVFCSTHRENDNKYWNDYDEFLDETDQELIANIVMEINKVHVLGAKIIRQVARSNTWRFRWNAGKTHGKLFECGLLDLSVNQQNLVYWSQVYDSVYESHERPEDDIINDDDKLDAWFDKKEQSRKTENALDGKDVSGVQLSNRMSGHGEIFVVANKAINPDAPDIQSVEGLNTSIARKFKRKELETIKKHGTINEKDLRGRKNKIARKLIGSRAAVLDKGSLSGRSRGGKGAKTTVPGENIG